MEKTVNFEKWAEGKPPHLAIFCHLFGSAPITAYNLLNKARDKDTYGGLFRKTTVREWIALYIKNRKILTGLFDFLPDTAGVISSFQTAINLPEKEYWIYSADSGEKQLHTDLTPLAEDNALGNYLSFTKTPQEEYDKISEEKETEENFFSPEFHFFIKVFIPCLILHRTSPAVLLRRSRNGDIDCLEKLLQLDSSIIFDERIAQLTHRLRDTTPSKHRRIIESPSKPAGRKVNIQKIKIFFSEYISYLSREVDHALTEPEIRALFDAVAKDRGTADIDTDLPHLSIWLSIET